ncbi:carbohydrate kinase family protein [Spongiivirga citrea]|uniref:Carbohydrate kinase n=1 Tax=Spongiivirga citrea TaxID=1481457 RepID=A0A6M0CF93_9FLAO|nr:carbohydrate kinase [Spongiivirga citrea]NER16528.1 carbohydrate kinase [Spongiivirga citrea]
MKTSLSVWCFGEVLWDVFPEGKQIGGAPLNVALRLLSLGLDTTIISAIGTDALGNEALTYIKERELNTAFIQQNELPTGNVPVVLDEKGSASYTIAKPVAWDHINYDDRASDKIASTDAFIYGSLACREETTRATLKTYLNRANFKIFDVNLRAPHYEKKVLFELMNKADMIKFNDEEIILICGMQEKQFDGIEDQVQYIAQTTDSNTICVTLGSNGALLYQDGTFYRHSGYKVQVGDTVGAGDSFLASLVFKLLSKESPEIALDFACAVGALVASKVGANAPVSQEEVISIRNQKTN